MKKLFASSALLASIAVAAPAQAVIIAPGSTGLIFDPFAPISATQGTQIAFTEVTGTAFTFEATMRAAVFRNTLGTLDFYYQVDRLGPGSIDSEQITSFTGSNFSGFIVDGFVSGADPDGAGAFRMVNNPTPMGGSTTTVGRSPNGNVLQVDFFGSGFNGLIGTENSATYIFRTDATRFARGTFGVIDGSTLAGFAFQPTVAIPEPATWAMMVGGFGLVGGAMRARRRRMTVSYS